MTTLPITFLVCQPQVLRPQDRTRVISQGLDPDEPVCADPIDHICPKCGKRVWVNGRLMAHAKATDTIVVCYYCARALEFCWGDGATMRTFTLDADGNEIDTTKEE